MMVICDISAWQYWRTPPILRDVWLDSAAIAGALAEDSRERACVQGVRSNAREVDRLVHRRLLGELKGVSLPVHVMVDEGQNRRHTALVTPHVIPAGFPTDATVDLGNGLRVLSPELTVAVQCRKRNAVEVAKMGFEACGIFSLLPTTERVGLALRDLVANGTIGQETCRHDGIFGYSDEKGHPLSFTDGSGDPLPWTPAFDRHGNITDLWKRPPLTSVERIARIVDGLEGCVGLPEVRRALRVVRNGAASPAEVQANLLLCSDVWFGGEGWGRPDLNRRIAYTPTAKALAHTSFCVADCLWPDRKADLEVQGKAFHADDLGFTAESGRRAALESMGYSVQEITYEQMADLELFDAMLPAMAKRMGFVGQPKTAAFLRRRTRLHRMLFDVPYDPA